MTAPVSGDRWGATPAEWACLSAGLALTVDLLPTVCNPNAERAPRSALQSPAKVPSAYNDARQYYGLKDWPQRQATGAQVSRWLQEPDLGICVQTRQLLAVDVDVDDPAKAARIVALAEQHFGDLPKRTRADSGRVLLPVRRDWAFTKRSVDVDGGIVEILGDGNQFIAAGTHPKGQRYEWAGGLPGSIPAATAEQVESFWIDLCSFYGVSDGRRSRAGERKRGKSLELADEVADFLQDDGLVLSRKRDGALVIACPWSEEHSSGEPGDGSTIYFPAGTNGETVGGFKCLHAHCIDRSTPQFQRAVGFDCAERDFDIEGEPEDCPPEAPSKAPAGPATASEAPEGTETVPESAKPSKPRVLRALTAGELRNRPTTQWLVDGWIPKRGMVVLYGDSNVGKSFAALDLGMAIARGMPWHGIPTRQAPVLYVVCEGGHGFLRRIDAQAVHHGFNADEVPFGVIDAGIDLCSNNVDTKCVIDACKEFEVRFGARVGLVIIDTLARAMGGGNENAAEDMGKFARACGLISQYTGATVVAVHHIGKDRDRGMRGSSSLKAATDTGIEVRQEGSQRVLKLTKQRDGPTDLQLGFKLLTVTTGVDRETDKPIDSVVAVPVVLTGAPERHSAPAPAPTKRLSTWQGLAMSAVAAAQGMDDTLPTRDAVLVQAERLARDAAGVAPARWRSQSLRAITELVERGRLCEVGDRLGVA